VQSTLSEFAERYWILGGIGTSLLWFLVGKESKHNIGPLWGGVGVVILLVVCGWAIAEQEWFGLIGGIVVLCIEVYWIMRARQRESASGFS
jgi:CHASE2 domain-containing sensor protein